MSHSATISPQQREMSGSTWTRLTETNSSSEPDQRSSTSSHLGHERPRGVINEEVKGTSMSLPTHDQSSGHLPPAFSETSSSQSSSHGKSPVLLRHFGSMN